MKQNKLKGLSFGLLALILTVSGIFAYFTDSETATNTFTAGNVKIKLIEEEWEAQPDDNGNDIPDHAENILPMQTVIKDPAIKNTGKNDAYVYLEVRIPTSNIISYESDGAPVNGGVAQETELFSFTANAGWTQISRTKEDGKVVYIYGHNEKLASNATTDTLFDEVTVVNAKEAQGLENQSVDIVVNAYAIQTANIGTMQDAWVKSGFGVEE